MASFVICVSKGRYPSLLIRTLYFGCRTMPIIREPMVNRPLSREMATESTGTFSSSTLAPSTGVLSVALTMLPVIFIYPSQEKSKRLQAITKMRFILSGKQHELYAAAE